MRSSTRLFLATLASLLALGCGDGSGAGSHPDGGGVDGGPVDAGGPDGGLEDAGSPDLGDDAGVVPIYEDLRPNYVFAEAADVEVRTMDVFAIWWDRRFEHEEDVPTLFARLMDVRRDCLGRLGMADPPNMADGFYYNVYIHHGADDVFPEGWGNGQGTNRFGHPFLTMPPGAARDPSNVAHEGFHIFQYEATSPGFAYRGDSQWFIETTAQHYAASRYPDVVGAFVEVGALSSNPQLTMWHSFGNEAPGDARDWLYQVRQYGMHAMLFYFEQEGVDPAIFTEGFYAGTSLLPQEYLAQEIGAELPELFADWAAHNTAGFDYLTPAQAERAALELDLVADAENIFPFAAELSGPNAEWQRPAERLPRSWAYNVIRVTLDAPAELHFELEGDATGSEGATSRFQLRAVVPDDGGFAIAEGTMDDATNGRSVVSSPAGDTFFVVASVPDHYRGNQTYGYRFRVTGG
ncbi:MAG: DUF6055 domain-containing protein [Myxococcota bacterium]